MWALREDNVIQAIWRHMITFMTSFCKAVRYKSIQTLLVDPYYTQIGRNMIQIEFKRLLLCGYRGFNLKTIAVKSTSKLGRRDKNGTDKTNMLSKHTLQSLNKKKICLFQWITKYISSHEHWKRYSHSWLRHSWEYQFQWSFDEIYVVIHWNKQISSI